MRTKSVQKNIPDEWNATRLGAIGVFSKGAGITKDQLVERGCNAVRYGELYTRHNFRIRKIYSYIPDSIAQSSVKIKYGDILFAGSGETIDEIGKSVAYLLKDDAYAGGDLIIFRPRSANSLFLSYFLNIGEARKKLRELGQGQSVVHVYKSDIENLKLHLPPLPEQKRIVAVLEIWDVYLEKLAKKIEIKKRIKKGVMQQLLTGKKRLHGYSEPWEIVKLKDCLTVRHGKSQKEVEDQNGAYPILGTGGEFGRTNQFLYDKPSVLIGRKGTIDKPKYMDSPFWTVDTLFYCEIKKNKTPKYLYYLFLTINWKKYNEGSGVPSLSAATISCIKVCTPKSKQEQILIANILTKADDELESLETKKRILDAQKKYLLNKLITGQIRTSEENTYEKEKQ